MATGFIRATDRATGEPPVDPVSAIDDLIKFRLVESMLRQPDAPTTTVELASRLGFHSVEVTGSALDELVSAGLLRGARRGGALTYAIAADPVLRSEVADLVAKGPPGLFNRLAAASVSRVKRLLKKR